MRASKLYDGDDCHKPFHHSCQLAYNFLGVVAGQQEDNPSKADPEPIYGKVHLVAQPVGRTRFSDKQHLSNYYTGIF